LYTFLNRTRLNLARKSLDGALFALSSRLDWAVLLASTMP
jgi:hypothetical protein